MVKIDHNITQFIKPAEKLKKRALFGNATFTRLKSLFAGKKNVIIDEAQRISDIGLKLKLITTIFRKSSS